MNRSVLLFTRYRKENDAKIAKAVAYLCLSAIMGVWTSALFLDKYMADIIIVATIVVSMVVLTILYMIKQSNLIRKVFLEVLASVQFIVYMIVTIPVVMLLKGVTGVYYYSIRQTHFFLRREKTRWEKY